MRTHRTAAALGLALLLLVLALPAATPATAQEGSLLVERFDALIEVLPDGTVVVEEEIAVDFGDTEHHGILRAIADRFDVEPDDGQVHVPPGREPEDYRRVLDIEVLQVEATAPDDLALERDGDHLVLRVGDPDVTVTGEHTYRLRYTVRGALNAFDDRAELYWEVTGFRWEGPIRAATAVVEAPGIVHADCWQGPEDSEQPCAVDGGQGRATFEAGPLEPGEGLTMSVGMPLQGVSVPAPLLEERWRLSRALTGSPAAVPLTIATAVLGLAAVALTRRRLGPAREPAGAADVAGAGGFRSDPPQGLRPAQLSLLVDERLDGAATSATLLDLAARGHLRVEQVDGDRERFEFRRTPAADRPDDLLDFERPLLDALFDGADVVTSDDLGDAYRQSGSRFREEVQREAVGAGWFQDVPSTVRARRVGLGAAAVAVAVAVLGAALALTEVALAAVPLVLAALAVAWLLYRDPVATPEGRRLRAEAEAFRRFLRDNADVDARTAGAAGRGWPGGTGGGHAGGTGQGADGAAAQFGRYLPYAIAFGAAAQWVERYRDSGIPVERWAPSYYVVPVALLASDPGRYAASVGTFTGHLGSSGTAPTTSTSSGGGAVGGGFGGGGGGGW